MKRKVLWCGLSLLLVAALVLTSCGEAISGQQEEEEEELLPALGEQEEEEEEVVPPVGEQEEEEEVVPPVVEEEEVVPPVVEEEDVVPPVGEQEEEEEVVPPVVEEEEVVPPVDEQEEEEEVVPPVVEEEEEEEEVVPPVVEEEEEEEEVVTTVGSNVQITRIFYDGLVYRVESDEYVEITNLGDQPQNLAGWMLKDISEGYPSFTFPSYILAPGASTRVYTNQIHPEYGGFSFGYGKAVWNNSAHDTAALYNNQGEEVSRKSY